MRILLINPTGPKVGMDHFLKAPPLGLMILAATVPDHQVKILDLRNYDYSPEFVERQIRKSDIVGVSASTSMIKGALQILRIAKEHEIPTILGGYHGSLVPETAQLPEVDVVVRGEGELTFPEIVNAFTTNNNLKGIKGISFQNGSKYNMTEDRPLINLNESPFPRRDLLKNYNYHYFWATIDA
ncbi:MAG: B12-binding domain-containing radical SAM protein, partial [Candidatus Helarchaeota archaeon]